MLTESVYLVSSNKVVQNRDADEHVIPEAEEVSSYTKKKSLSGMAKYWLGKDYTNFIVKDFTNLDAPYQGNYNQLTVHPCLPYQAILATRIVHKLLLASLFGCWQTWWIATQPHECHGMILGQWSRGLQPEMCRAILYSVGMLSRFV